MSTLGWFACLCACLAVGCAKKVRQENDTNNCIDENGVGHEAGERYPTKCGYCDCVGYGAYCLQHPCEPTNCGEGFIMAYDYPNHCCPFCAPDTSRTLNRIQNWHRCEDIECGWLRCKKGERRVLDDPNSCCPYCAPREATAKREVDESCDRDACPVPMCAADSIYIENDPDICCPYCLRLEFELNDDPCHGIMCDVPDCGKDGELVSDDPDSCCPYCKV